MYISTCLQTHVNGLMLETAMKYKLYKSGGVDVKHD